MSVNVLASCTTPSIDQRPTSDTRGSINDQVGSRIDVNATEDLNLDIVSACSSSLPRHYGEGD